ncbi:MAG TPA: ATP-binding cassette domain-containing protein [Vicinamibacteria bacterium]
MDRLVLANIADRPTRAAASVVGVALGICGDHRNEGRRGTGAGRRSRDRDRSPPCRGRWSKRRPEHRALWSTFLHIIGRLLSPTGGKIFVRGDEMTSLNDSRRTELRRREIGFVFQRFNLFPTLSVEEDLRLAEGIHNGGVRGMREMGPSARSC